MSLGLEPAEAKRRIAMIDDAGGFWAAWELYGEALLEGTPFDDLQQPISFVQQILRDYDAFLRASTKE